MGGEFWRTVVERVAAEVPDTLLLAEAFWMMESYFVRSLGMHRVYNSAFMHMMRDQDNAGYRGILKELLEFDPRVLQRYVNFMNNPDEESAREQFGDGDRYFAVATLLATMPGLPMIGHGQFEGYREKYGMEFRRAKRDERPEGWLVERHERELVPVLRRRAAFAGGRGVPSVRRRHRGRRGARGRVRLHERRRRRPLAGDRQPPVPAVGREPRAFDAVRAAGRSRGAHGFGRGGARPGRWRGALRRRARPRARRDRRAGRRRGRARRGGASTSRASGAASTSTSTNGTTRTVRSRGSPPPTATAAWPRSTTPWTSCTGGRSTRRSTRRRRRGRRARRSPTRGRRSSLRSRSAWGPPFAFRRRRRRRLRGCGPAPR